MITQISAAFGKFNTRRGAYLRQYGTKRYYYGFKRRPQIGAALRACLHGGGEPQVGEVTRFGG